MQNNNTGNSLTDILNELVQTATSNSAGLPPYGNSSSEAMRYNPAPATDTNGASSNTSTLESELQRLTGQMTLLRQVNEVSQSVLSDNTKALAEAVTNQGQGFGAGAATTAKNLGSLLLGGLGIGSLVSGIASLFGGEDQPSHPPAVKYALPAALQYQGAVSSSGAVSSYDYNDRGGIRAIDSSQTPGGQASPAVSQQVVIQVNAMDSKSFMDHSDEIAQAVRAAILNSSSLNDVISEM
jgi:hypothetical protein